jgi:primary-amine oxidase
MSGLAMLADHARSQENPPDPNRGRLVEWEGWSFRWSVRKIEGLVITDVKYRNHQVLKYAGLCELQAPYAHGYRTRDLSLNVGFGTRMEELIIGKDCYPGSPCNAFDANGEQKGKFVVMMHEEPLGLMYFGKSGRAYGKMLVLWSMARFPGPGDGYVFILRWKFRSDGVLIPEIGATGTLQFPGAGDLRWSNDRKFEGRGPLVAVKSPDLKEEFPYLADLNPGEKIVSPSHVHCFCFRLDFDIDGAADNAVEQFDYHPDEPGSALAKAVWTRIEKEAGHRVNPESFRSWRIVNLKSKNSLGHYRSYQLFPGGNGAYRGERDDRFSQSDMWVTRNRASEFPYSSLDKRRTEKALPDYLNGESVSGTDVVVWYMLSFQHEPRTEDWFEMPAVWNSFKLVPRNFLAKTPISEFNKP